MMWQDLVFLAGSGLSIAVLAPTVRETTANVPLGSSVLSTEHDQPVSGRSAD